MCGIVMFRAGTNQANIVQIVSLAENQKHRGQDGIGIIYRSDDRLLVTKNLHKLEEMNSGELDNDGFVKRVRVGSFEYVVEDDKIYEEENNKFKSYIEKFSNTFSDLIILHHRKGTAGDVELRNQHPVYVNEKFYIHNGTAEGYESVRGFLEDFHGIEFFTDTDTEVLAKLYNLYLTLGMSMDEIYESFCDMFPNGFGILVEIDNDENITLLKDSSRNLWKFILDDDSELYLSEPNPDITNTTTIGMMCPGCYNLDEGTFYNYTKEYKDNIDPWDEAGLQRGNWGVKVEKCKYCGYDRPVISSYYLPNDHPSNTTTTKNICFECLIINSYVPDLAVNNKSRINLKQNTFGKFLGKKEEEQKFLVVSDNA